MSKPQGPFALTDANTVLALKNALKKVAPKTQENSSQVTAPVVVQKVVAKPAPRKLPAVPTVAPKAKQDLPPPVPKRDLPPPVPKRTSVPVVVRNDNPPPLPPRDDLLEELANAALLPVAISLPIKTDTTPTSIPQPPKPPKMPVAPKNPGVTAEVVAKPALLFCANDLAAKANKLKKVAKPVENAAAKVGRALDDSTQALVVQPTITTDPKVRPSSAPATNANGVCPGLGLNDELLAKLKRRNTHI